MLSLYLSLIENETEKTKFEAVYYTYRKQMFLLANSILNSKQDAEDAVHDVFLFCCIFTYGYYKKCQKRNGYKKLSS